MFRWAVLKSCDQGLLVHGEIFRRVSKTRAATVQVLGEERHPRKGLGAVGAGVLLDVGMSLKMGPQVGAVGEGSVAEGTGKGLLAGVRADVPLQEPRAREGFAAQHTLAGQGVGADVHLQRAQRDVHLLAVLAAEGLLGGGVLVGGAVELLMLAEAGVGGV